LQHYLSYSWLAQRLMTHLVRAISYKWDHNCAKEKLFPIYMLLVASSSLVVHILWYSTNYYTSREEQVFLRFMTCFPVDDYSLYNSFNQLELPDITTQYPHKWYS
jgi:hypothetical protein